MAVGFLTPDGRLRVFSDLGVVLPGAKLHTYVAGTPSTNLATYSDVALTVPNLNPLIASAGGLFGPIYLTPGVSYKLALTDAADVPVWTQDNISMPATGVTAPVLVTQGGTGIIVGISGGVPYFPTTTTMASSALLAAHGVVIGGGAGTAPLTTAAGVAGQALLSGGPAADPSFQNLGVTLLDKSLTEQIIAGTVAETAFYSKSIPGNTLVAATALRLMITGTPVNTSGGAINFTINGKLGGTTFFTVTLSVGTGTTMTPWNIVVLVNANNASNAQRATLFIHYITTNLADGTGGTGVVPIGGGHSAMAVDMTAAQTLQVTVTMATAAGTISFKRWGATLELLQ